MQKVKSNDTSTSKCIIDKMVDGNANEKCIIRYKM